MKSQHLRLVLADDHEVVRKGLKLLLESKGGLDVVGEASDGRETLQTLRRLKPDVLVLDLMMPGLGGLEVLRRLGKVSPDTRVVVLSMYAGEPYVVEALRHGAAGYVLKDAGPGELLRAVREAAAGRRYLSPPLSERALQAWVRKTRYVSAEEDEVLTPREREILQLTAEGLSSRRIAANLSISPRTAETHRANIKRKLGFRSQSELVRFAIRKGMVPLEPPRTLQRAPRV